MRQNTLKCNINIYQLSDIISDEVKEEWTDNDIIEPGFSNGCTKNWLNKDY